MKENYISFVLEEYVADGNFDALFGDQRIDESQLANLVPVVCDYAFADYGIDAKGKYATEVAAIFEGLSASSAILTQGDDYTGYWYKLRPPHKKKYLDDCRAKNPATNRIAALGEEALRRALNKIVAEDGLRSMDEKWVEANSGPEAIETEISDTGQLSDSVEAVLIPASDRFVTLGHNQQTELESAADTVIGALEKENSVDGNASVRAWMLGQLRAARELIRAQTLNVWLLEQTVLNVLGRLIEKYKDHAIGAAAKTLMELLIKHIFGIR